MPAKKEKPHRAASVEMDRALKELAELSLRFPFRWFAQGTVARICGFGEDMMHALATRGAPIIARKCNPNLLHRWMEENIDKIGKIRRGR